MLTSQTSKTASESLHLVGFRCGAAMHGALRDIARREDRSVSAVCRRMIEQALAGRAEDSESAGWRAP